MARRTDEGDRSRLPLWAQRKLEGLERQVEVLQDKVAELKSPHADSNVKVSDGIDQDYGLPPNSIIDFYLGADRRKWSQMITVQHLRTKGSTTLRISAGGGQLVVLPSGGCNVVEVRQEGF